MEPPETSKLKNREIEADTFVQAFLQNMRESQRTLSLVTYHKVKLGSFFFPIESYRLSQFVIT